MLISVATANLFYLPFAQALEIIAAAGFKHIELDLYWERGSWAMAQHLQGMSAREVVRLIDRSGLTVSTIHDGGGVLEDACSGRGLVNPRLAGCLDELGYAPGCIVFHTPHIEGGYGQAWWRAASDEIVSVLDEYRARCAAVTIENMPLFDGYYVPITTPEDLLAFASEHELGITLDTTHYAQIGVDIVQAARVLGSRVKTVHLSDYADGDTHVLIGDGHLDLGGFCRALDLPALHSITVECAAAFRGEDARQLGQAELIERLAAARTRLHRVLPDIPQRSA